MAASWADNHHVAEGELDAARLHTHYASNAQACGHEATCALVTTPVNWPTLMGRPECTCGPSHDEGPYEVLCAGNRVSATDMAAALVAARQLRADADPHHTQGAGRAEVDILLHGKHVRRYHTTEVIPCHE